MPKLAVAPPALIAISPLPALIDVPFARLTPPEPPLIEMLPPVVVRFWLTATEPTPEAVSVSAPAPLLVTAPLTTMLFAAVNVSEFARL